MSFWSFRGPILSPPGGVFGLPNDSFGATNMRSNHHIYPVATPLHYRRSGPGGMRVAIRYIVYGILVYTVWYIVYSPSPLAC